MQTNNYQPGQPYCGQLNIKSLLKNSLLYGEGREIIYRDKARFTYPMFYERVNRLANALHRLGVQPKSTVGVLDYDSHRYLECFFAIPMMGATLHTVNWRFSPEQILYTICHAEDDILLVHSDFIPLLEGMKDRLSGVKKIVLLTEGGDIPKTNLCLDAEYESMLASAKPDFFFPDMDENTRATTFYTTGTTGLPKGVFFSHRQIVLHTLSVSVALSAYASPGRFRSDDVYMPLTPMFHVHAWGFPYLATLLGTKQVYPGKYELKMLFHLIGKEKVTFSHCVPTILHMLVSSHDAQKPDMSHWKVMIGGATLTKALAKAAMDLGIELYAAYGMSETCPAGTVANLKPYMLDWDEEKKREILVKTGIPFPLMEMEIFDEQGNALAHDGNTCGEVVLRGPWLTQGYSKDPEKTKELWRDGWLHTGDIGKITPDGYLEITDRMKDMIKTGGEWISSLSLENLLSLHPAVSEVAVIGIPNEKWGERPLAIVVLKPGQQSITRSDLREYLYQFVHQGKISKYALPERYEFVSDIPKTSVGKINKVELRKRYCQ